MSEGWSSISHQAIMFNKYNIWDREERDGFSKVGSRIIKLNILTRARFENSHLRNYENTEKQELKLSKKLFGARIKINFFPVLDSEQELRTKIWDVLWIHFEKIEIHPSLILLDFQTCIKKKIRNIYEDKNHLFFDWKTSQLYHHIKTSNSYSWLIFGQ